MKNPWLVTIMLGGLFCVSAGCGHVLYADGPYHGKLIDRETKQPIAGAAVVAVWWKETPAPHPIIAFYDAQDTLTDQEGKFTIVGIVGGSPNPLAKIREPLFTIFKPGYRAAKQGRLPPPKENGRTIIELIPLKTREERVRNMDGLLPGTCFPDAKQFCVPEEKILNLRRLMNSERASLGLEPTYAPKGGS